LESRYFPIALRLDDARVLIVGGGEVAARKLRLLQRAAGEIDVVAETLGPEVEAACNDGRARHRAARFDAQQLDAGYRLVVAATDDREVNRAIAAAARARNIPVNAVDDPAVSSFTTPAIVDRSPLLIAISSGGAAPVLARRMRERIETLVPAQFGRLAGFMHAQRERMKAALPTPARRAVWERFLDGAGAEAVMRGDDATARDELERLAAAAPARGEVYLVGAGPGDPDLLTFRALRLMQQADAVLYDRLLPESILELVRRDAERVFVGKRSRQHTLPQSEINAELVRRALAGQRVLRLKGGDPFVFGCGGEEIETLAAAGVPFQVVPGITAANGCAAYAGIPLTHRDCAQACVFVTGHARADGELTLPWDSLAQRGQTVVIYMGLASLPMLCARLIDHGLPADWPAALVEEGTTPAQRVIAATLGDLPGRVTDAGVAGASLVIVGEVVRLRDRLDWYRARTQGERQTT
jgi:uroporphyrin-III C-methyltransferase/precorrin-2 dehydrogenase/sirohydrochlorin ferrochelatase